MSSHNDDPAARERGIEELYDLPGQRMSLRAAHQRSYYTVPASRAVAQLQDRRSDAVQLHLAVCANQYAYAIALSSNLDVYALCKSHRALRPRNSTLLRALHRPTTAAIFRHALVLAEHCALLALVANGEAGCMPGIAPAGKVAGA